MSRYLLNLRNEVIMNCKDMNKLENNTVRPGIVNMLLSIG